MVRFSILLSMIPVFVFVFRSIIDALFRLLVDSFRWTYSEEVHFSTPSQIVVYLESRQKHTVTKIQTPIPSSIRKIIKDIQRKYGNFLKYIDGNLKIFTWNFMKLFLNFVSKCYINTSSNKIRKDIGLLYFTFTLSVQQQIYVMTWSSCLEWIFKEKWYYKNLRESVKCYGDPFDSPIDY